MANRDLYRLERNGDAVIVYRVDNNLGRQGVVFADGAYRKEYYPYLMPKYIIAECLQMLKEV
jgi:hypothetical protein